MFWNKKEIGYGSQLGILLGLTGAGLILSMIVSVAIWNLMIGGSFPTTTEEILQPKNYNANMVIQGVSTFCIFFLPAILFAKICYASPNHFLGFTPRFNYQQVLLTIGILMVAIPVCGAIGELNRIIPLPKDLESYFKGMESSRHAQEEAFIKIDTLPKYIISLFMIGLLPAIFEEIFFRGAVQNLLSKMFRTPWPAIIITGIIFSLIHLSYYGFLVRFSLGVILGALFYYSKNLWLPIIFHFIFNGLQVTALYVMTMSGIKKPTEIEQSFPLWLGLSGLVFLIYLMMVYKKKSEEVIAKFSSTRLENQLQNHRYDEIKENGS